MYDWPNVKDVLHGCDRVLIAGGLWVICYHSQVFLEERGLTQYGFNSYEVKAVENLMSHVGVQSIQTISAEDSSNSLFYCTCGKR